MDYIIRLSNLSNSLNEMQKDILGNLLMDKLDKLGFIDYEMYFVEVE